MSEVIVGLLYPLSTELVELQCMKDVKIVAMKANNMIALNKCFKVCPTNQVYFSQSTQLRVYY